jgi:hypothetical protein
MDSLHVEIDNFNDLLVGFCFIRSVYIYMCWETDFLPPLAPAGEP